MHYVEKILITTLLAIFFASSAFASYEDGTRTVSNNNFLQGTDIVLSNLNNYLQDTSATGAWDITAVSTEAGYTNTFVLTDGTSDTVLFSNKNTSNWNTAVTVDLESTYFNDGHHDYALDTYNIYTAIVTTAFYYGSILFDVGDLVIMFNDSASDKDYDDFLLHGTATPIPGAVWLLGSGLVGLVGIRRKFA